MIQKRLKILFALAGSTIRSVFTICKFRTVRMVCKFRKFCTVRTIRTVRPIRAALVAHATIATFAVTGALLLLAALSTGCGDDTVTQQGDGVPLQIDAVSTESEATVSAASSAGALLSSVALRSSTELTSGSIGVYRVSTTDYTAQSNVQYTCTSGTWAVASGVTPIYLYSATASVCAYYPYSTTIGDDPTTTGTTETNDPTAIPLTSQLYSTVSDLCYATGIAPSSAKPKIGFTMNHAYAKMSFTITRDTSYEGTGNISQITVENAAIISSNTLDITTGTYGSSTASGAVSFTPGISSITSGGTATASVLMVPVTTISDNVVFSFTVDGETVVAALPASTNNLTSLAAGNNYVVSATISGKSLVITHVAITDWADVTVTNTASSTSGSMVESNCYIVQPGGVVYIPVSRVTTAWTEINGSSYTLPTDWTTGLLWTDNSNGLSSSGAIASIVGHVVAGYITVTAGSAEGNSVIAIYDTDGSTILWSWHIWTTSYNPNSSIAGDYYWLANSLTSNVFMDRNLGATSDVVGNINTVGLLYQWGRKDPFPDASAWGSTTEPTLYGSVTSVTKTAVTVSSNLSNAIQNPLTFYYGTSTSEYDWYSVTASTHNDLLWGGASSGAAKTIYDPCPAGWRVPSFYKTSTSTSPWEYLACSSSAFTYSSLGYGGSYASYGWTFTYNSSSIGCYPAAGYRHGSGGALANVGSSGHYWSGSPSSSNGYFLIFLSSNVYPAFSTHRAYGFSVRCVQEF